MTKDTGHTNAKAMAMHIAPNQLLFSSRFVSCSQHVNTTQEKNPSIKKYMLSITVSRKVIVHFSSAVLLMPQASVNCTLEILDILWILAHVLAINIGIIFS